MAGLVASKAIVWVEPPLLPNGNRRGSVFGWSPGPASVQVLAVSML
jgi:hypothetical protein